VALFVAQEGPEAAAVHAVAASPLDVALEVLAAAGTTGLFAGGALWLWRRRAAANRPDVRITTIEVAP